jgi:hypothetical protein
VNIVEEGAAGNGYTLQDNFSANLGALNGAPLFSRERDSVKLGAQPKSCRDLQ